MIADMARTLASSAEDAGFFFCLGTLRIRQCKKSPLRTIGSIIKNPTCEFSPSRASPLSWNSWILPEKSSQILPDPSSLRGHRGKPSLTSEGGAQSNCLLQRLAKAGASHLKLTMVAFHFWSSTTRNQQKYIELVSRQILEKSCAIPFPSPSRSFLVRVHCQRHLQDCASPQTLTQ